MKKLINFRYTYFPLLGIVLGVVSSLLSFKEKYTMLVLIDVIFLALFCFFFYRNLKSLLIDILIFLLFFTAGFLLFYFWTKHFLNLENPDGIYHVYGKVASINFQDGYNVLRLKDVTLENGYEIKDLKIFLTIDYRVELEVGDYVDCFAETKYLFRDFTFDDMYYMSEGISFSATALDGAKVISSKKNIFELVNLFIKNAIFNNMPKDSAGVAYALIVGNCSYIPKQSNELYKVSGLFHIFSVSGMHISFIASLIHRLTKRLPINHVFVDVFIIILLFFYCGICGFVVCAIRSAITTSFMLLCDCIGQKHDMINATFLSLIILIFVNPFNLLNVGCLLSYTSVLGLIILADPIKRILKFLPNFIAESFALSISATIMSMPITLYVFGSFAPISILYNLVIVPLIYVVFLLLIIFIFVSIIFKRLFLFKIAKVLINWIDYGLKFTKPSNFLIEKSVNYYFMYPYYAFALCFSDLTFIKTKIKIIISVVLLAVSIGIMFI